MDIEAARCERLYEIGFDGDVRAEVRLFSPTARVLGVPTNTILWSRESGAADVDLLLDSLLGMGIAPHEVHEAGDGHCEVRIGGRLGEAMLGYLGWSHRVVRTTVVKLRASQESLGAILRQMSLVTRVDYVVAL